MADDRNPLGEALRSLQKACDAHYKDISECFENRGCSFPSKTHFSHILHGRKPMPRLTLLRLIIWRFGITKLGEVNRLLRLANFQTATTQAIQDIFVAGKKRQVLNKVNQHDNFPNGVLATEDKFFRLLIRPFDIKQGLLPKYRYEEVSFWRTFTKLYPDESIHILDRASQMKGLAPGNYVAIAAVSSALAKEAVVDGRIQTQAVAITARLAKEVTCSTVYSYPEYCVFRKYLYSAAEAGACPPARAADFIHNHPVEWELRLNGDYYGDFTNNSLAKAVVRKDAWPTERDEYTGIITECQADLLPKDLLRDTYSTMKRSR